MGGSSAISFTTYHVRHTDEGGVGGLEAWIWIKDRHPQALESTADGV